LTRSTGASRVCRQSFTVLPARAPTASWSPGFAA
jgi:hypothetical protein